jgi:hypothetical protein
MFSVHMARSDRPATRTEWCAANASIWSAAALPELHARLRISRVSDEEVTQLKVQLDGVMLENSVHCLFDWCSAVRDLFYQFRRQTFSELGQDPEFGDDVH